METTFDFKQRIEAERIAMENFAQYLSNEHFTF